MILIQKFSFVLLIFAILSSCFCGNNNQNQTDEEFAKHYLELVKKGDVEKALTYKFRLEDEGKLVQLVPALVNEKIEYTDEKRFIDDFKEERQRLFRNTTTEEERVELDSLESRFRRNMDAEYKILQKLAIEKNINIDQLDEKIRKKHFSKIEELSQELDKKINSFQNSILKRVKYNSFQKGKAKAFGQGIYFYRNNYIIAQVAENETQRVEVEKVLDMKGCWRIFEHN